jgi:hypothetical protein
LDGDPVDFGVTGYTYNRVFVLYDRKSGSVWYPLTDGTLDAISGPQRGRSIEFIAKPERMTLGKWIARHPGTLVMLPPPASRTVTQLAVLNEPEGGEASSPDGAAE